MQLKWGTYAFDANAVEISAERQGVRDTRGVVTSEVVKFSVSGWLTGTSQTDIAAKQAALGTALRTPFVDLKFYADDGTTVVMSLPNAGSLHGTQCTRSAFPTTRNAEYAVQRSFSADFEAEYPVLPASGDVILSWSETVELSGGGAQYRFQAALNGPPVSVLVAYQLPYRIVQSGQATGQTVRPTPPSPLFPSSLIEPATVRKTNDSAGNLSVTWQYVMESATILTPAEPALWP